MKVKCILIILLSLLTAGTISAIDYGLLGHVQLELVDNKDEGSIRVDLWPHFSTRLGDNAEFTISGGLTISETFGTEYDDYNIVPELLQTDLTMRFPNSFFRVGRMNYSDPLSIIAEGLFDGFQYIHDGGFNIGAWYTGFLYKNNANIVLTAEDREHYDLPLDNEDLMGTYFATRRLVGAFGWEHRSLLEVLHLNTALIGQIDLTDSSTRYHSMYAVLRAAMPLSSFLIQAGGAVELSHGHDFNISILGVAGVQWTLPVRFPSMLSLSLQSSTGVSGTVINPFEPITTKPAGVYIQQNFSGLSILSLNYSARFARPLGVGITASYFVRNDLETYQGYPVSEGSGGRLLGPELSGRVVWSPFSDLQFSIGGGAFFPVLGNAGTEEPFRWKVDVSATISIF